MAKSKSVYVCSECGAQSPQWLGRCPGCGKFGTLVEELTETPAPKKEAKRERGSSFNRPLPLSLGVGAGFRPQSVSTMRSPSGPSKPMPLSKRPKNG